MEKDELKHIDGIFAQNLNNDFFRDKLKEMLICKILLKRISYITNQNV